MCQLHHIKGPDNIIAEALSRHADNSIQMGFSYSKLSELKQSCQDLHILQVESRQLKCIPQTYKDNPEKSTGCPCPCVPYDLHKATFYLIHNLAHTSGNTTAKMMAERFIWKNLKSDVKQWCSQCEKCQITKISWHAESGITPYETTSNRLAHLHVDVVEPLPNSRG